ncbi:MAG: hypothetical protein GTO14_24325 [Anaerolineales bacterium]|nr:hypothetical protein [Anaerolineales bacterium]
MPEGYPIHDLFIRPIEVIEEPGVTRWPALADTDHLLRRFGHAEIVRLQEETKTRLRVREVADEIWALVDGSVEFIWHDLRTNSPSYDRQYRYQCDQPTLVLVPFGVAFGHRLIQPPVTLLRITTHANGETTGDREFDFTD